MGLSPFQCCLVSQSTLFLSQESDVVVHSRMHLFMHLLCMWRIAREVLTWTGDRNKASADRHHTKPPLYVCCQKVWLSPRTSLSNFPHVNVVLALSLFLCLISVSSASVSVVGCMVSSGVPTLFVMCSCVSLHEVIMPEVCK